MTLIGIDDSVILAVNSQSKHSTSLNSKNQKIENLLLNLQQLDYELVFVFRFFLFFNPLFTCGCRKREVLHTWRRLWWKRRAVNLAWTKYSVSRWSTDVHVRMQKTTGEVRVGIACVKRKQKRQKIALYVLRERFWAGDVALTGAVFVGSVLLRRVFCVYLKRQKLEVKWHFIWFYIDFYEDHSSTRLQLVAEGVNQSYFFVCFCSFFFFLVWISQVLFDLYRDTEMTEIWGLVYKNAHEFHSN